MEKAQIGIYGLGVMGSNLALNFEDKGYRVALFNKTLPGSEENRLEDFLQQNGEDKNFIGTYTEKDFLAALDAPRIILLMVKAGEVVDRVLETLTPLLDEGDILIDGGNSHYEDTGRRLKELSAQKLHFVGLGVSGGAEGARNGPSLMPGGSLQARSRVLPLLNRIAAKDSEGRPCCSWIGKEGAGHFVKMVHNGIEYADMQLIAECYDLLKRGLGMDASGIASVFEEWNRGELNSYLLDITIDILGVRDGDGSPLVEKILDTAGQKGTGRWTAKAALDKGAPLPVISSAVHARMFSSLKNFRNKLSGELEGPEPTVDAGGAQLLESLPSALLAARLIVLAEGFYLIQEAGRQRGWEINPEEICRIWQNGCIIRSELLKTAQKVFQTSRGLPHLLADPAFARKLSALQQHLRRVISPAHAYGLPTPAMSNALLQYDMLRTGRLPANLIQAQRDYFGAHGYELVDRPRGTLFHSEWKPKA